MTPWLILLAAAALAGVAAGGVLRPFGRSRAETLERLADPLEDERQSLVRSLRDLEEERATGAIDDDDYRSLRHETEVRAVAVLRALEARDRGEEYAVGLGELRDAASPNGQRADGTQEGGVGRRRLRAGSGLLAAALVVAVLVPLIGAVAGRAPDEPLTGTIPGGSSGASDALTFFEQRVRDHPQDVGARLDLAQRYLDAGDVRDAVTQYGVALELDPNNAEAHTNVGYLLYLAGRPQDGLTAVQKALAVDPTYPEGLYVEGVILLRGLNRPVDAAAAFRAYLAAAPFGSRRDEVQALLAVAEGGSATPTSGGTASLP